MSISEFYVMPKAKLRFIVVHNWNRAAHVRPRTGVLVGEGGEYVEYYANLAAVKTLQTSPRTWLEDAAKAHTSSILLGLGDAEIDVGTTALLEGSGAVAELATRAIATDKAVVTMRALVEARAPAKGHVECNGLIMLPYANVETIPQLAARHHDAVLTHEASIGKLAEDEINYLQAKGFAYDEAVFLRVCGFITTDIHRYMPEQARRYIEQVEKAL